MNEQVAYRTDRQLQSRDTLDFRSQTDVPAAGNTGTPPVAPRRQVERIFEFTLWWLRDGIPFGVRRTTRDGLRILSICAVCGRIRNAAGDWAVLPEAWWPRPHVLSHGYCPECAEREGRAFLA